MEYNYIIEQIFIDTSFLIIVSLFDAYVSMLFETGYTYL